MPVVPINYLAVLGAAVSSMVIGALWYGPLFGKQWIALMGWTPEKTKEAMAQSMGHSYLMMFVGSIIMSFVLAHALVFASAYLKADGISAGLMAGFWNWLGFIAPVMLGSVIWEGKSWKLWVLNTGYYLVMLSVMGVILSLWK